MKKLRIYKDEYEQLPQQYKQFKLKNSDGLDIDIEGLKLGRRCFKLEQLEIVEKGKSSARSGARHIGECKECKRKSLMYASGLCAACYQKENFKKNHPDLANKRETNVQQRKLNAQKRERVEQLKLKWEKYPYNLILDTFGETAFDMFGDTLDNISDNHTILLDNIIDRLSDSYRNAVIQYYKENKTFREIGESFGCTSSWVSNMVKRFRETVEANREAIKNENTKEIVYLKHMYKYDKCSKMVTWSTIKSKLVPDEKGTDLKDMFSPRTYRYLRKAGIYTLEKLKESLKSDDDNIQKVKGVGFDVMSEILSTVYTDK